MMTALTTFVGFGTVANVVTVLLGTTLGLVVGHRLGDRARASVTDVLGLFTCVIGALSLRPLLQEPLRAAVPGGAAIVVVLVALLSGALLGTAWRLEDRIEEFAVRVRRLAMGTRAGAVGAATPEEPHLRQARFVNAFVTSTLLFCVGPMAILGSLQDGLGQGAQILLTKAVLDGFAAIAFASALGAGVYAAALVVGLYQGALTVVALLVGRLLDQAQVDAVSVAGGVILLGLGLRLLELKAVRVADLLPGLVLAPVLVWVAAAVS